MTVSQLNETLKRMEGKINARLDRSDKRMDATESKVTKLEETVDRTDKKMDAVESKITKLEETVEDRRELDVYAFADQSERSDYASNLMKNNSVLLTGTFSWAPCLLPCLTLI